MSTIGDIATVGVIAGIGYVAWKSGVFGNSSLKDKTEEYDYLKRGYNNTINVTVNPDDNGPSEPKEETKPPQQLEEEPVTLAETARRLEYIATSKKTPIVMSLGVTPLSKIIGGSIGKAIAFAFGQE